jgi:protein-tyrosine-phosphatase
VRAAGDLPVCAVSRGTLDLRSASALPEALEEAERLGLDLAPHRPRSLLGDDLSSFELVLGFERHHLAAAVAEAGAARERTFTLPQIVRELEDIRLSATGPPLVRARHSIEAVVQQGSTYFPLPEIGDPIGRPRQVQREIADQIAGLITRLARRLFG